MLNNIFLKNSQKMLILSKIFQIKVHVGLITCLHAIFRVYVIFLINCELIVIIINIPIMHLNALEDYSDPYSRSDTVPSDFSFCVVASRSSDSKLILARFSATVAALTVNVTLSFLASFALLPLALAAKLLMRNLLQSDSL